LKFCLYNITTAIKNGGIETYYWEVSKQLDTLGHEVELISGEGNFIRYEDISIQKFPFTSREKIVNLGNRFRKWAERISFFFNAKNYLKLTNYDVLLIHKPFDFFVCYFMKKYHPQIKTVFVSGGEDFYGFDRFFSKYVDFMISVSNDNEKRVRNRYELDVDVIPNGVDIHRFYKNTAIRNKMRQHYQLDNKKVLMSVGRVVGLKGFQLVIEALVELDEDFIYLLAGDGEYLQTLKELAKQYKVEHKVVFLGNIDNTQLQNYLNMADIYIQPTIGNEAFGITIIEAMACELPVVASNNGGIVDIIKDGDNGYLFEVGNITNMLEKINQINSEIEKFSLRSRETVVTQFSWESCVNSLITKIG